MVSYYNPVAMFGRTGSAHSHSHHSTTPQNPYFSNPYNTTSYHHHYSHSHHHQGLPQTSVGTAQFSPANVIQTDCNNPYQHQIGNMTPESMAAAAASVGWHQPNMNVMYSACASTRNMGYDDWTHPHPHPHPYSHSHSHSSFYHHQSSPPNSTPSPNSTHNSEHISPNVYPTHPIIFKSEFGHHPGVNPQENSSHEIQSGGGGSSTSGSLASSSSSSLIPNPTSHSPDSGMAISDGVSSSGSPATTGQQHSHCINPQHHQLSNLQNNSMIGSQQVNLNHSSHHTSSSSNNPSTTTNITTIGRPTQARSPFEWMKKSTYTNSSTNSNGKTRTKDKYRVVYSDTQRMELEKEFHYSRYITIRRKSELATLLGLSERQVKIWFQNRRAKDRKTARKHEEMNKRDKVVEMVHMQNAAVLSNSLNPTNGMFNQGNLLPLM